MKMLNTITPLQDFTDLLQLTLCLCPLLFGVPEQIGTLL